jgi:hypothetical protein
LGVNRMLNKICGTLDGISPRTEGDCHLVRTVN